MRVKKQGKREKRENGYWEVVEYIRKKEQIEIAIIIIIIIITHSPMKDHQLKTRIKILGNIGSRHYQTSVDDGQNKKKMPQTNA